MTPSIQWKAAEVKQEQWKRYRGVEVGGNAELVVHDRKSSEALDICQRLG